MDKQITYLFDVDGTLTNPLEKMDSSFAMSFLGWMTGKRVFLAAGSRQIPSSVLNRLEGIFCCMGNEFWQKKELIYKNDFKLPFQLKELLVMRQMYGGFTPKPKVGGRGPIFEERSGMVNFTTIGRAAEKKERLKYYEWDQKHKERESIAKEIEDNFPELEARLGGQISIDIQPKGNNKSLASKWVRDNIGGEIVFIGDKCFKGGNDYDIVLDLTENKDGVFFQVDNPNETLKLLEDI